MNKRIFTKLSSIAVTMAIVMSYGMFINADEINTTVSFEETVVSDAGPDSTEMAEGFIEQKMSRGEEACYAKYDYSTYLSGANLIAFNYLRPEIVKIANGEATSSKIVIPDSVLTITYSNEDLGIDDFRTASQEEISAALAEHSEFTTKPIMDALLMSSPYELYWYDKTKGCSIRYSWSYNSTKLSLLNFEFDFSVASEYQDGDLYTVNSSFAEALDKAAAKVNLIIEQNAGLDDYNKLMAYNDAICLLTDYNHPAADGGVSYGNPWQLVWVFDGSDSTKVVCEGYSKAFQYLCDNSAFDCDTLYAISVSGSIPEGNHMWNIVHMDDGKNYLVDVTNSDPGGNGNVGYKYFLKGATSGSVSTGYTVNSTKFTYKSTVISFIDEDVLTLASSDYEYVPAEEYDLTLADCTNGSATLSKTEARAGTTVEVTVNPNTGFELDTIKVNDEAITGTSFTMPESEVIVEVIFKKSVYSLTLGQLQDCTATLSDTSASYGDIIKVNVTPSEGYEFDYIKINGVSDSSKSFIMPAEAVTVDVYCKKTDYTLSIGVEDNCTATLNHYIANIGDEITVDVIPADGYEFDYIKVNGIVNNSTSFTMPAENVKVDVYCKKIDYVITVVASNGDLNVPDTANAGDTITITALPDIGYVLDSITVNGETIEGNEFVMPYENVTIEAVFELAEYSLSIRAANGCEASLSAATANYGDEITVTVTPDTGYEYDYILVNGIKQTELTFAMPAENVIIDVYCKAIEYNVLLDQADNCDVTLSKDKAFYGDVITITVDPDEGYVLDYVTVNGTKIDVAAFSMPAEDVTVIVVCKKCDYQIKIDTVQNCDVSLSASSANFGDEITVTVTPLQGYGLSYIKVNGEVITGTKFIMPANDVLLEVVCVIKDFSITLGQADNCEATFNTTSANFGDEITVTVVPADGYELDYIKVNNEIVYTNTFTMPAEDVTVDVICKLIDYAIIVEDTTGGTVTAPETANAGDSVTVTATPNEGYKLGSIKVNGEAITGTSFTMPAGEVTITVTFAKISYKITVVGNDYGTAKPSKTSAHIGDKITIKLIGDVYTELEYIKVNGEILEGTTFTMPASNVTVEVAFKPILFNISVTTDGNGTATATCDSAGYDDEVTVTAIPAEGYELDKITVNGTEIEGTSFLMDGFETSVVVTFKKSVYSITLDNVENGSASLSATSASLGDEITITPKPAEGYELDSILVNGEAIEGTSFIMDGVDTNVVVAFKKTLYSVTLETNKNCYAELSATSAGLGDVITITVKPVTGYELDSILVNGEAIEGTSFTMPAKDTTVEVKLKVAAGYNKVKLDYDPNIVILEGIDNETVALKGMTIYVRVAIQPEYQTTYQILGLIVDGTFIEPSEDGRYLIVISSGDFEFKVLYGELRNGWFDVYGNTFFYENGLRKTGWVEDNNNWYYLEHDSGVRETGWVKDSGNWYYMDEQTAEMQTGWVKDNNTWYYMKDSGAMATGWVQNNGNWYYLSNSGAMTTGWKQIGGNWYLFDNNGSMKVGWVKENNDWYYLKSNGEMATGWFEVAGKWFFFSNSGAMVRGWLSQDNNWYYLKDSGEMASNEWAIIDNDYYYFYQNGVMAADTTINGYYVDKSGRWIM